MLLRDGGCQIVDGCHVPGAYPLARLFYWEPLASADGRFMPLLLGDHGLHFDGVDQADFAGVQGAGPAGEGIDTPFGTCFLECFKRSGFGAGEIGFRHPLGQDPVAAGAGGDQKHFQFVIDKAVGHGA